MPSPTVLEPITQKNVADCAIASLAMLLGRSYAEVSAEALRMTRKPHTSGLGTRQINSLAKRLGATLYRADAEGETGLIYVEFPDGSHHAAVLFEGVLINPADGLIYSLDVYLATTRSVVRGIWCLR